MQAEIKSVFIVMNTSKRSITTLGRTIVLFILCSSLFACKPNTLPTIGRTHGDLPMTLLLVADEDCYRVQKNVYFEAPFATGMSFSADDCLASEQKVGRKSVSELASMHVTVTFDGEFYIVKHGY